MTATRQPARISRLVIENYRSIREKIQIDFPRNKPVVLIGENNAGKSNIVRALNLVLGPFWPGSHEPEDNEFNDRDRNKIVSIEVQFDNDAKLGGKFTRVRWRYDRKSPDSPVFFRGYEGHHCNYISNDHRDTCMCVVIEAERNLQYHLSYSSKWTLLSRLMHRFHRALTEYEHVREDLRKNFEDTKKHFFCIPEFAEFARNLRQEFGNLVAGMTHRLEIDFEAYNPINFFHALRLQAVEGEVPVSLEEMGTGEQQVLALAFAYAYAKAFHTGLLLIVEEPEAHLHPLAQNWLAQQLRDRCAQGLQVLITTHSPAFLWIEDLEGLVLVYKEGGATRVKQLTRSDLVKACVSMGVPPDRVKEDNVLPFYEANATADIKAGFFARVVVLVEGPTEALALPELLAKCNLSVAKAGIAVIPVGGKGNLAKWYRMFTAYGIPCYVVFDNDDRDDRRREKRRDILLALGEEDGDLDNVLQSEDWVVREKYTVFREEYEESMKLYFEQYKQLEQRAEGQGIATKPLKARWVAKELDINRSEDGWKKIREMKAAIEKLTQG